MALPRDTEIQFRYAKHWISDPVLREIESGAIREREAVICYIDQSTVGNIYIIPCRMARIVDVAKLGSSLATRIRVTDLPLPKSFNAVRNELQANADCPGWQEDKLRGKWFLEQAPISLQHVSYSELVAWEDIIKELLTRNDFTQKKRDFFFHVNGISAVQSGASLAPIDGEFRVAPSTEYELDIYHFYPKSEPPSAKSISLASSSDKLSLFSLQRARIDSPYDLKSWRFKCEGDIRENSLILEIRTSPSGDPKDDVTQIDIPAIITVAWASVALKLGLVAGGVVLSSLTALAAAGKLTVATTLVAFIGALLAAAGTVWKSKS